MSNYLHARSLHLAFLEVILGRIPRGLQHAVFVMCYQFLIGAADVEEEDVEPFQ